MIDLVVDDSCGVLNIGVCSCWVRLLIVLFGGSVMWVVFFEMLVCIVWVKMFEWVSVFCEIDFFVVWEYSGVMMVVVVVIMVSISIMVGLLFRLIVCLLIGMLIEYDCMFRVCVVLVFMNIVLVIVGSELRLFGCSIG